MTEPVCFADFRRVAKRRLPSMLFNYIEGGSYDELTLVRNVEAMRAVQLRQRVMRDVSSISLKTELFGENFSMPVMLAPVGMTGLYARRGEVQAIRAAEKAGVPACLSAMSICSLEEVAKSGVRPPWFQLYMIKDRGYMRALLARAKASAARVLVFTVDLQVPGSRYRDMRSGLSGQLPAWDQVKRAFDVAQRPNWIWDVYMQGRPHTFGNIADAVPEAEGAGSFWVWVRDNFDPSVTWDDIAWVREQWDGPIVVKGVLDVEDAKMAVKAGADGVVVSNHGGRQLDGVPASIEALPAIAAAVGDQTTVLMDGGVRTGLDVVRALALGAKGCLLGRTFAYALAARGEAGVSSMLEMMRKEMLVAMALTGCTDVHEASRELLV